MKKDFRMKDMAQQQSYLNENFNNSFFSNPNDI
jgi:hypothetical protein